MITPIAAPRSPDTMARDGPLWEAARALEASFLAQMLSSAGLGTAPEGFGGGIGEEQYASLMRDEQARSMVGAGGIGLAESIFKSLAAREDNA